MKWKKGTMIFIGVLIVAITAWDVFVLVDGGTESSISHVMIAWAYRFPIFPFLMGVLCGHLFWRMPQTKELDKIQGDRK